MSRHHDLDQLYDGLAAFSRRSRELGEELHPGLSLVAYTLLSFIQVRDGTRAADIASTYGLDKSTVSRQVDQLVADGQLLRCGERPGRRGQVLAVTAAGQQALDRAASTIRGSLVERLTDWEDGDIATFARLVDRFNLCLDAPIPTR
jgi:DNA-binding MarR family transcriptional regulator